MASLHPILDTPVAYAVEEALASVATEPVRDAVLTRALREARRTNIPERGPDVVEFAEGPLRHALASRLGEDVASEVLEQLRPVLERAARRASLQPVARSADAIPMPTFVPVRSEGGREPEIADEDSGVYVTPRPLTDPAPRGPLPIVFFASQDASASAALAQALGGRATVRIVEGLLELLDAVTEDADAQHVLVLDGGYPSIQLHSLITVAPELASSTKIVVWRVFEADRAALASVAGAGTARWICCEDRDVEHLAESCTRALG